MCFVQLDGKGIDLALAYGKLYSLYSKLLGCGVGE